MTLQSCARLALVSIAISMAPAWTAPDVELLGEKFPSGEVEAVVVAVDPVHVVTLEVSGASSLRPGDRVEVIYTTSLTPMILGVYEVATVQGKRVTARPLTLTSEPMPGMQVRMARKGGGQARPSDPPPVKTHEDTVHGHGDEASRAGLSFDDSPAPEVLTGVVDEVRNRDIVVVLPQGKSVHVRPGQTVEAFLVLGSGKELAAGRWKVSTVEGDRAICAPDGPVRPRKGLKAVIRSAGPASAPPPDPKGSALSLGTFDRTASLLDPKTKAAL